MKIPVEKKATAKVVTPRVNLLSILSILSADRSSPEEEAQPEEEFPGDGLRLLFQQDQQDPPDDRQELPPADHPQVEIPEVVEHQDPPPPPHPHPHPLPATSALPSATLPPQPTVVLTDPTVRTMPPIDLIVQNVLLNDPIVQPIPVINPIVDTIPSVDPQSDGVALETASPQRDLGENAFEDQEDNAGPGPSNSGAGQVRRDESMVDLTANSTQPDSVTEHNRGFIDDSQSVSIANVSQSLLDTIQSHASQAPKFATAPSSPTDEPPQGRNQPPNSIFNRLEDASFFTPPIRAPTHSISSSSDEAEVSPSHHQNLRERRRTEIPVLVIHDTVTDEAREEEEDDEKTPTVNPHFATEVFSHDKVGYVVQSPSGHIPVDRFRAEFPPSIQPSLSNSLPPDQASTSSGQSELRTKMRTKGNKSRPNSALEAYPLRVQERLTRTRAAIESQASEQPNSSESGEDDDVTEGSRVSRHNLRDLSGKFKKKSHRKPMPDDT